MLRSGSILGVAGLAACLTLVTQPIVRDGADQMQRQALRPVSVVELPASVAGAPAEAIRLSSTDSMERRAVEPARAPESKTSIKPPRRLMKEGCEGAISSLAGPEARRMVPGRCIA